jgi:hypothetical protein
MGWNHNNDDYEGDEVETWYIYDVRDRDNENSDNEIDRRGFIGDPVIGDDIDGYRIVGINRRWNYVYIRR